MNGGGKRQLPSWMLRSCTVEQTSVSEVREEYNENDSKELDIIASQTQKKAKRKKQGSGVSLVENKSHLPSKCEGRKRDRKASHEEEDQLENETHLLKKCRTRKSKRMYKEEGEDQGEDLGESNLEINDGPVRKKYLGIPPRKKTNKSTEDSFDEIVLSEDELTVEDLVSIANEYVNADMKKPKNLQINSETRSSIAMTEKDPTPTVHQEDTKSDTYKPLSAKPVLTDPLTSTGDPALEMLDLLFGGLLKKSEEAERKNASVMKNIMLDCEINERSKNDTVAEVVPVMKKKVSLKDKMAMLLD